MVLTATRNARGFQKKVGLLSSGFLVDFRDKAHI